MNDEKKPWEGKIPDLEEPTPPPAQEAAEDTPEAEAAAPETPAAEPDAPEQAAEPEQPTETAGETAPAEAPAAPEAPPAPTPSYGWQPPAGQAGQAPSGQPNQPPAGWNGGQGYGQQPPAGRPPYGQTPPAGAQGAPQQPYAPVPPYAPYGQPRYPYAPYGQPQNAGYGYGQQPPAPPQNGAPGAPQGPQRRGGGGKLFAILLLSLAAVLFVAFVSYALWEISLGRPEETGPDSSAPTSSESSLPAPEQSEIPLPDDGSAVPAPDGDLTDPDGSGIVLRSQPAGQTLSATEVYERVAPSIVCIIASYDGGTGIGSGIIATEDGAIVTNSHVLGDSRDTQVRVLLHNGDQYDATIVGLDKVTDLAVIQIDADGLTAAEFGDSADLSVGQDVVAIGNPSSVAYQSSMTRGIISGLDRTVSYSDENNMTYIQTDVAISPGNSGGALVNLYGQVVGITSSKISGVSYEGINFAIPSAKAEPILDQLMANGYVANRARLGITCTTAAGFGVTGVEIVSINPGGSFDGTQVQPGDIITEFGGRTIASTDELYQVLALYRPGDTVTVTLLRMDPQTNRGVFFEEQIVLLEDTGENQEKIPIPVQ